MSDTNDDLQLVLHDLIQACLTGVADRADVARLERLIIEDPHARQLYVRYMEETAALQMFASRAGAWPDYASASPESLDEVEGDAGSGIQASLGSEAANPAQRELPMVGLRSASCQPVQSTSRYWSLAKYVGCVMAAAAVVVLFFSFHLLPLNETAAVGRQRVALLHQGGNAILLHNGLRIEAETGQWLESGRYQLESGILHLVFPWGTEATFEAPAIFELQPNDDRRLLLGQMVAKVPAEDTGFTVDTPSVEVIDLGTEFGLMVSDLGDCEVHVFKGEVETREKHDAHSLPMRLTAGQATRFAASAANEVRAKNVEYNPHRFSRAWQTTNHVSQVTGAMRYVHPAPASVVAGDYESGEDIRVFLERQGVSFPKVTAVTLTQPGLYTTFASSCVWIPPGIEFDSYLIHYDPLGDSRTRAAVSAEGAVTFEKPIVAVIARGDQLAATDAYCASPSTNYFGINKRGIGKDYSIALRGMVGCWRTEKMKAEPVANDQIRLSPDRRTLTVQLSAGNETDQIRVLVANQDQLNSFAWENLTVEAPVPFFDKPYIVGETIQAENFDVGGDGIAYYDSTPSALSSYYRYESSIEILPFEESQDEVNYCIALCAKGEWTGYTIFVERAGDYVLHARVASDGGKGKAHFEFGEHAKTKPIIFPNTQDALAFQWVTSEPIQLPAGRIFIRLVMDQPNSSGWVGNIDCFRVEPFHESSRVEP